MDSTEVTEVKYIPDITTSKENVQELKPENVKKSDTLFLTAVVIGGSMLTASVGEGYIWTSAAVPMLKSNNTNINPVGRPITTLELSLLAGLPSIAMLFGALVHGYLSEQIGRKRTLQIGGVGILLSATSIAFCTNIVLIIIIRCFWFFFSHGSVTVFPFYLTEICEDHNRGKYGCLAAVFLPVGNCLGYTLGSMFSYKYFTLMGTWPFIFFLGFMFIAPETPVYSLSKNRREECIKALTKLRSNKTEKEIQEDVVKIEAMVQSKSISRKSNILSLFKTKERRYSLMLACGPLWLHMICGIGIILPFMEPIFIASGTNFDSSRMPIIVSIVKIVTFLLTSLIIERAGKRLMLQISSAGVGIPLFVLGLFFHLKSIGSPLILQLQWLPLVCITVYIIFFSLGIGPVPSAIMGEFFTPDLRAAGLSVAMTGLGILSFCSSSSYPILAEVIGIKWCMWLYGTLCVLGAVFVYLFLPETKGKSLLEIQEYIKSRCKNK